MQYYFVFHVKELILLSLLLFQTIHRSPLRYQTVISLELPSSLLHCNAEKISQRNPTLTPLTSSLILSSQLFWQASQLQILRKIYRYPPNM